MRFVPVKSAEQQSVVLLHRTRDLLVRKQTMLVNALPGEFGVIGTKGISRFPDLLALADTSIQRLRAAPVGHSAHVTAEPRCHVGVWVYLEVSFLLVQTRPVRLGTKFLVGRPNRYDH
jgi:hypothetical protein